MINQLITLTNKSYKASKTENNIFSGSIWWCVSFDLETGKIGVDGALFHWLTDLKKMEKKVCDWR